MGLITFLFGSSNYEPAALVSSSPRTTRVRGPNGRFVVQVPRNTKQLYEERGWNLRGIELSGYYRTRFGAFKGRIDRALSRPVFFIVDPPSELIRGPHSACFTEVGRKEFRIHWSSKPIDCNTGILYMERCISEALS